MTNIDVPSNVYDQLKCTLSTPIVSANIELPVPLRRNVIVVYSSDIDMDKMDRWMRSAKVRTPGSKGKINTYKLAILVLEEQCIGFKYRSGDNLVEILSPKTNEPLTFNSDELKEMVGVIVGGEAVITSLYGRDSDVIKTMDAILESAGYGDVALDEASPLAN